MTPTEKAKELFDKYKDLSNECDCLEYSCICFHMGDYKAKDCAFIVADEILKLVSRLRLYVNYDKEIKYWKTVKKEINKL